ncbi:hypothetical protein BLNAU_24038 [Blattamonas nauphoetae]|uniref:Uncharacterized protein n=1 Tax=Blattamonas nauphoetae TaxID=2049346 RepID=A0ABQ9WNK3_9EUKA|nr:hypothetical protein BLNAU_24038 [Blattamonas nauphoetae]
MSSRGNRDSRRFSMKSSPLSHPTSGSQPSSIVAKNYHIKVEVRGSRKTGKTQFINMMCGAQFSDKYEPTLKTVELRTKLELDDGQENIDYTYVDAIEADQDDLTISSASTDCIIYLCNPLDPITVSAVAEDIQKAPAHIPKCLVCNFLDEVIEKEDELKRKWDEERSEKPTEANPSDPAPETGNLDSDSKLEEGSPQESQKDQIEDSPKEQPSEHSEVKEAEETKDESLPSFSNLDVQTQKKRDITLTSTFTLDAYLSSLFPTLNFSHLPLGSPTLSASGMSSFAASPITNIPTSPPLSAGFARENASVSSLNMHQFPSSPSFLCLSKLSLKFGYGISFVRKFLMYPLQKKKRDEIERLVETMKREEVRGWNDLLLDSEQQNAGIFREMHLMQRDFLNEQAEREKQRRFSEDKPRHNVSHPSSPSVGKKSPPPTTPHIAEQAKPSPPPRPPPSVPLPVEPKKEKRGFFGFLRKKDETPTEEPAPKTQRELEKEREKERKREEEAKAKKEQEQKKKQKNIQSQTKAITMDTSLDFFLADVEETAGKGEDTKVDKKRKEKEESEEEGRGRRRGVELDDGLDWGDAISDLKKQAKKEEKARKRREEEEQRAKDEEERKEREREERREKEREEKRVMEMRLRQEEEDRRKKEEFHVESDLSLPQSHHSSQVIETAQFAVPGSSSFYDDVDTPNPADFGVEETPHEVYGEVGGQDAGSGGYVMLDDDSEEERKEKKRRKKEKREKKHKKEKKKKEKRKAEEEDEEESEEH